MNRKYLYLISSILITSCGTVKKKTSYGSSNERKITVEARKNNSDPKKFPEINSENPRNKDSKTDAIINTALEFSGTRYKFGGTTKKGLDCSGLVYVAFNEYDISLPRISYQMAEEGKNIRLKDVIKGDLLFFKTSKKSKKINHVGLVVSVEGDEIKFKEGYWNYAFIKANRIL